MNDITPEDIINKYNLKPHFEGGYYLDSYCSKESIKQENLPTYYSGDRPYCNSILYLLPQGSKCILHKILQDELWHFLLGDPLELYQISPSGTIEKIILGQNILLNQSVFHVVPKGYYFGALPQTNSRFCFVSCATSPGFYKDDWTQEKKDLLLQKFPQAKEIIEKLI